ncbi:MAG TPA: hypothetical protein VFX01_03370 [Methylophilaceae bacterium]|nr:hypothetical protein [Methylophilaceae bacterium]
MRMFRRFALSFSLILLFAFGQQGGAVHEISHFANLVPGSQQQDKAPHSSSVCDKCLVYGSLASAIHVAYFSPALLANQFETTQFQATALRVATADAYLARAPPVLA